MNLTVNVTGTPAPQGSKKGFYNPKLQRVQMTESSSKVAPWRQDVVAAVLNEMHETGWVTPAGPVAVGVEFRLARPGYHYRTGRHAHELRPDAPHYVDKKPDIDKLLRSTHDALTTSGAIKDDAQIALLDPPPVKRYAAPGESTGALIIITPLNTVAAASPSPPRRRHGPGGTAVNPQETNQFGSRRDENVQAARYWLTEKRIAATDAIRAAAQGDEGS